jgi:hypothetical protein
LDEFNSNIALFIHFLKRYDRLIKQEENNYEHFDKHDLSGFVGKHLVYTYDNGWNYEIYVKNETTLITVFTAVSWQPLGERSAGLHRAGWGKHL